MQRMSSDGFICPGGYENLISEKGFWIEKKNSI
jgi:hypothetical protein